MVVRSTNHSPLCRRHHHVKRADGWTLTQPEPGVLTWTTPNGRSYTVTPNRTLARDMNGALADLHELPICDPWL
jgi:hypothetical protein